MASVYTNDLRLEEIGSGEQSGTWGDTTNTNLELIAEGLSFGTEAITTNADTHASTVADGATDPARSMYIKYTGALDSDCTITIGPNTISRMHFIENATTDSGSSGPYNIIISQGSGANVTIPNGEVKAVYLDGAGSGAAVVDAFASLNVGALASGSVDLGTVTDAASVSTTSSDYQLQLGAAQSTTGDIGRNISFGISGVTTAAINSVDAGTSNAQSLAFFTGNGSGITEAMRIDSSQNILIGAGNTSSVNVGNGTGAVQIADTTATPISALRYNNSAGGPFIMLGHSRSTTVGTVGTVVSSGDDLGTIRFCGDDGTDVNSTAAAIVAEVDGTPGSNDMPGRLKFETTADGSDSTTERMRIDSSGHVLIGTETGDGFNDDSMLRIGRSGDRAFLQFKTDTSNKNGILFGDETDDVRHSIQFNPTDNTLSVIGDSAEHMTFASDGTIGFGTDDPASFAPSNISTGRDIVNRASGGGTFIAARDDNSVVAGNKIGGYLFRTNDSAGVKFGGLTGVADDTSGGFNLDFFAGRSTSDDADEEGHMQLDDAGDLYIRSGGLRVGRSHSLAHTSVEESVVIYQQGSGSGDTATSITARNGTAGDNVFRHQREGSIKSEIEENGDFLSATGSYGTISDERLKENIEDAASQWDDIKAVKVKKYSFKEDELDAPNMIGVMAQDLQAAGMNGLVTKNLKTDLEDNPILDSDGNQEEFFSVKYSILYMKAIKALQEAMAKIETLETEMTSVKSRLDALEG